MLDRFQGFFTQAPTGLGSAVQQSLGWPPELLALDPGQGSAHRKGLPHPQRVRWSDHRRSPPAAVRPRWQRIQQAVRWLAPDCEGSRSFRAQGARWIQSIGPIPLTLNSPQLRQLG